MEFKRIELLRKSLMNLCDNKEKVFTKDRRNYQKKIRIFLKIWDPSTEEVKHLKLNPQSLKNPQKKSPKDNLNSNLMMRMRMKAKIIMKKKVVMTKVARLLKRVVMRTIKKEVRKKAIKKVVRKKTIKRVVRKKTIKRVVKKKTIKKVVRKKNIMKKEVRKKNIMKKEVRKKNIMKKEVRKKEEVRKKIIMKKEVIIKKKLNQLVVLVAKKQLVVKQLVEVAVEVAAEVAVQHHPSVRANTIMDLVVTLMLKQRVQLMRNHGTRQNKMLETTWLKICKLSMLMVWLCQ